MDGNDYWILKEANLTQIDIVVLEYNPIFGAIKEVTVPRDDEFDRHKKHFTGLYYGASLKAYINLLSNKNYLDYICHNEDNHLHPFIDSSNGNNNIKVHMAEKIMEDFTGTRKICRITHKFNIFKIKFRQSHM